MGLFDSLTDLASDALKIVSTPIEIAVDAADALVKPVAEGLEALRDELKDLTK